MGKGIVLDLTRMKFLFTIFLVTLFGLTYSSTLNVPATYSTIQAGLNAATTGDIVLVGPGAYVENISWPATQGITLKSTSGSALTIIDGSASGRVITFPTGQNYTNTTIIDGFTIQNGYLSSFGWVYGAGIYAKDCSAIFKNLIVKDNLIGGATSSGVGTGIYAFNSPNLVIDSCAFNDNELMASSFLFGGVIYCESNTDASITNCTFANNKVTRIGTSGPRCYGGVIYAEEGCDLTISDIHIDSTTIQVNSYIYGGAIFLDRNESTLTNVKVSNTSTASNSGRVYGGGIYYNDGDSVSASATWNNITISGQDILATSYILGGALYVENTTLTVNNSFFTRSVCNNSGGRVYGGGVYISGGAADFTSVYMTCNQTLVAVSSYNYGAGFYIDDATVTLTNALIAHNEATNANTTVSRTAGLGIYMGYSGTLTATNVTVTENTRVGGIASYGTGLANFGGTVNLINSIFWNNDTGNEIQGAGTNNITYSDIRNGYAGTGNINSDPLFVTTGSDYHLQASSPCVNAATATGAPSNDLDGNPRPVGGGYDMGAFEQQAYTNIDFCPILVLPIKLSSFSGECKGDETYLYWTTSSEINNDYFSIERSSDGYNFYEIATKNGAGNSNIANHYHFIDDSNINSVFYYRLKQVDFDGNFSFSNTISTNCFTDNFSIYPNPSSGTLNINIPTSNPINKIIIFNSIGQIIDKFKMNHSIKKIDISKYANGLYQIQFIGSNQQLITKKFIKQ